MWRIERQRRIWKPYYWILVISSHGMADGRAWTKKGAAKQMLLAEGKWFSEQ